MVGVLPADLVDEGMWGDARATVQRLIAANFDPDDLICSSMPFDERHFHRVLAIALRQLCACTPVRIGTA